MKRANLARWITSLLALLFCFGLPNATARSLARPEDMIGHQVGQDYKLARYEKISAYFRYVFDEYDDRSVDYNTGAAHLFLAGASAVY